MQNRSNIYLNWCGWHAVDSAVSQSHTIRAQRKEKEDCNWVKGQAGVPCVPLSARWPQTQTRLFLVALQLSQQGITEKGKSPTPFDSVKHAHFEVHLFVKF